MSKWPGLDNTVISSADTATSNPDMTTTSNLTTSPQENLHAKLNKVSAQVDALVLVLGQMAQGQQNTANKFIDELQKNAGQFRG